MVVIWFVVVIVAALIEINTMDLTSIWFSVGALFAFVIAIVEKEAIPLQFIAFLVVTGGLLLSVRPIARNYLRNKELIDKDIGISDEVKYNLPQWWLNIINKNMNMKNQNLEKN